MLFRLKQRHYINRRLLACHPLQSPPWLLASRRIKAAGAWRMDVAALPETMENDTSDRQALLLMLSYVEAECRRLGAHDAARQVALAASALAKGTRCPSQPPMPALRRRPRGLRVH
jgi:hypothetical protein